MDFIDEFILEYKNNPCLWKAHSLDFKNRSKRLEAYHNLIEVAAKHGEHYNVERTKQKINNLRCAFRHQLKKYTECKTKGEKEELYCPKRKYFESLLFLKDEECGENNKKYSISKIKEKQSVETGNTAELRVLYNKNKPNIISVTNLNEDCENNQQLVQKQNINSVINTALEATKETSLCGTNIIEFEEINSDVAAIDKDEMEPQIVDFEKDLPSQHKIGKRRNRFLSHSSQQSNETDMNSTKQLKIDVNSSDFEKLLAIACKSTSKNAEDHFTNFGNLVAHKLRSMETAQAIYAEKIITDVIFHGQMKALSVMSIRQFGNLDFSSLLNENHNEK